MMRRSFARPAIALLATSLLLCAAATTVDAARPPVKGGVPVDALTPAGMTRLTIGAPMAAGLPARLTYAPDGAQQPTILIDVLVAASAADARTALARWTRTVARTPEATNAVGDHAYANDNLVGFTRANVLVVVRRVAGAADVLPIAQDADTAVIAAPNGNARPAPLAVRVPSLATGASALLVLPGDVLAADVKVTGAATIRRERSGGWRLTRTGDGAVAITVTAVDSRLRPR